MTERRARTRVEPQVTVDEREVEVEESPAQGELVQDVDIDRVPHIVRVVEGDFITEYVNDPGPSALEQERARQIQEQREAAQYTQASQVVVSEFQATANPEDEEGEPLAK